jgi:hypothetical protein
MLCLTDGAGVMWCGVVRCDKWVNVVFVSAFTTATNFTPLSPHAAAAASFASASRVVAATASAPGAGADVVWDHSCLYEFETVVAPAECAVALDVMVCCRLGLAHGSL